MLFSLAAFALAALLVGLQFTPVIGDVLTFFGASYLVGLLINIGFVALAFEGLSGRAPRGALPLTLLYFGGYYLLAGISHIQANQFAAGLRAFNQGKTVAYDPRSDELVLRRVSDDVTYSSRLAPRQLLDDYGLDRVLEIVRDTSGEHYRAAWIEQRECPALRTAEPGMSFHGLNYFVAGEPEQRFAGLCMFYGTTSLAADPVTISTDPIAFTHGLLCRFERQAITVERIDGPMVQLAAGYAAPLAWVPWPKIGREMTGAGSHSAPVFRFLHEEGSPRRAGVDPLAAVVATLRLRPNSLKTRFGDRLVPLR